jgi:late competence protein required for DNA uptake (superfamily II DNA/RNA helicase)
MSKMIIANEEQMTPCTCVKCERRVNVSGLSEKDKQIVHQKDCLYCPECLGMKRSVIDEDSNWKVIDLSDNPNCAYRYVRYRHHKEILETQYSNDGVNWIKHET